MNKFLISEGSAQLGAVLISEHGGFETGRHDAGLCGYYAKLTDEISMDWNKAGHGLTYDLALVSLYFLVKKNELPPNRDVFYLIN